MAYDLTGLEQGKIRVLRRAAPEEVTIQGSVQAKHRWWWISCSCGVEKAVPTTYILHNRIQSCGCGQRESNASFGRRRARPYGEAAKESLYKQKQRFVRRRGIEFHLSFETFISLSERSCHYCGIEWSSEHGAGKYNGSFKHNGIDRLESDFGYWAYNCVSCCATCNRAKGTMTKGDFLAWVDRVFLHTRSPSMNEEFPDRAQRFAVCQSQSKKRPKSKK